MKRIRCYGIIMLGIFFATLLVPDTACGGWWRRGTKKTPFWRRKTRQKTRPEKAEYRYIKSHDFNNDGIVDAKDRLLWLKQKQGRYASVLISEENKDLAEMMDVDGNGDVQPWEMQQFIKKYDSNKDGILEDNEISTAAE